MKFEAQALEFPFVERMPKREKSKVVRIWEAFEALSKVTEEKGMLVPQSFAAKVLGVSRQRVWELVQSGRLESVDVNGVACVTENSIVEFAKSERKSGRPPNIPETKRECLKRSMELGKEVYRDIRTRRK